MGNLGTLYTGSGFGVFSEKKSGKTKMRFLNQHNFVATWSLILKFLHGADLVLKRSNPGRNGSIQSCGFCISRTERRTRSFWNHPAVRASLGRLNNGATADLLNSIASFWGHRSWCLSSPPGLDTQIQSIWPVGQIPATPQPTIPRYHQIPGPSGQPPLDTTQTLVRGHPSTV